MKCKVILLVILLATVFASVEAERINKVPRLEYLEYARRSADWTWDNLDSVISRWRENFDPDNVFGYRPPGGLLEMALIYSTLFAIENNTTYGERARQVLITYGDYRSIYPKKSIEFRSDYADGVPALPDFFTVNRYIRAFNILKKHNFMKKQDLETVKKLIAQSIEYLLRTAEWGTMNRTVLRAESLSWAVRTLPDHPRAPVWEMQRRALGDDNWGNWEIEDATIYHGVWLYSLLGYAHSRDQLEQLLKTPEMYYYAHYFLNLICPTGTVPDFGDANFLSSRYHYLVFFEAAANIYRDPRMKWAAVNLARKFVDFSNNRSSGLGVMLLDTYLWSSDTIEPLAPEGGSMEVMEDVQGKKIVFRNGWLSDSTYMLLNYRDEGDGGLNFRDYLRDTIPVEEEKMTHGHADENSIITLMSGGSILLHDGGYRDYMPSGPYGAFRQDYFHNRLCVRPEKMFMGQQEGQYRYSTRDAVPGQGILEFLRNAGSYRRVRTQKVDFISLEDFDYSRTRLFDDLWGYEHDRVITFVKDPEMFVVFDIFKAKNEDYYTLANLWHTRKILARGDHWYDTVYDRINQQKLSQDTRLLIKFPLTHFRLEGVEEEKRNYTDELVIHQTTAQHFELGETVGFITVLVPHSKDVDPRIWQDRIESVPATPAGMALGVRIKLPGKSIIIGVKNDLRMDISRDWRRPRYTYDAGKILLAEFETNGDFIFAELTGKELSYTVTNLTGARFRNQQIFATKPSFFGLAFDASPDSPGSGKVRYWRGRLKLNK